MSSPSQQSNFSLKNIYQQSLQIGLLLELIVVVLAYVEATDTTTFFQCAARLSGRVSLLMFAFVVYYFSSNWNKDTDNQEVMTEKYRLSRDFAIIHLIHWCFLAVAVSRSNFELVPLRVLAGIIAYTSIVVFPYFLKIKRLEGKKFFQFQSFYLYYTWFIMFMTYISRVKEPSAYSGTALGYQLHLGAAVALLLGHFYWKNQNQD